MSTTASEPVKQDDTNAAVSSRMPPCLRCGGLLVKEWVDYLEMWRCIACGDRIDQVVIEHRIFRAFPARPTGLKVFAWLFDAASS